MTTRQEMDRLVAGHIDAEMKGDSAAAVAMYA